MNVPRILLLLGFFSLTTLARAFQTDIPFLRLELPDSKLKPMEIGSLSVDVKVVGNLATTTYDITFYNPNGRLLEGDLRIPLAEGQTMARFALEVEGALREGVAVEKTKGRETFEQIVRRNVDPALLEQTQGNNFRARVYPIPARGTKRLVYAVEESLPWESQSMRYTLPLLWGERIKDFSMRVEVVNQTLQPQWESDDFANLTFDEWNESYVAERTFQNFEANHTLRFRVPKPASWQQVYVAPTGEGDYFFMAQMVPQWEQREKDLPKNLTILWDASASAADRNLKREMELLEIYFKQNRNVQIELVPFRDVMGNSQIITIRNGDITPLRQALESVVYDGGTRGRFFNQVRWRGEEVWLFSDGLFTLGDPAQLLKRPVYTINSIVKADHDALAAVAAKGGGAYLNLNRITPMQAVATLMTAPYQYLGASATEGEVFDVYPATPQALAQGQVLTVVGRTASPEVKLEVRFGQGATVQKTRSFAFAKEQASSNVDLGRRWAYQKYQHLALDGERKRTSMISLAKAYTLVTPLTSLIVLETLEDYLEYEIVPPAPLRDEYMARLEDRAKEQRDLRAEHIATAERQYQERIAWWETEFVVRPRPKVEAGTTDSMGAPQSDSSPQLQEVVAEMNYASAPPSADEEYMEEEAMMYDEASDGFGNEADFSFGGAERQSARAEAAPAMMAEPEAPGTAPAGATVSVQAWDPDQPYLQRLKDTTEEARYATYLAQRKSYQDRPSFFLDVAIYFHAQGEKDLAYRILSNLAELELNSDELLRVVGYQYRQWGQYELAEVLMRKVLELREELPQSYRDLAQVLVAQERYTEAADLYMHVIAELSEERLSRFPNIRELCLYELNELKRLAGEEIDTSEIPEDVQRPLPVDVRVVMSWNVTDVDIDLWMADPYKERCGYSNKLTQQGARYTSDYTGGGLGPEEILLRKAKPGEYSLIAHYYGASAQRVLGPTTVQVTIYTNYGRPEQAVQELTLQLENRDDDFLVGTFTIE